MAWFGLVKDLDWHKKAIDALSIKVDYDRIIEINKSLDDLFTTYFIDSNKATELVLEKEKIFAVIELQNDWIYSLFSNTLKELKKPKIRVKITASGKNPDKLFSILAETGRYPSKFKEFLNVRNHNSKEIIAYLKKSDGVQAKLLHQKMKPSEKAILKHKQFVLNVRQELIDVISKVERYYGSYSLAQRAVAFSAAIAISLAVYAVDVDGRGVRLGVSGVEAGEVVKDDMKELIKQAENYYDAKKFYEAQMILEKLQKIDPDNSVITYGLASALMMQGKNDEAIPFLEIFVQNEPDDKRTPRIKEWLEKQKK